MRTIEKIGMYFNGERFWSGTTTKKFSSTTIALGLKRIKMEKTDASEMKVSHYAKWLRHSSVVHTIGSFTAERWNTFQQGKRSFTVNYLSDWVKKLPKAVCFLAPSLSI